MNATPLSVTTDSSGNASFAATGLTVVGGDIAYTATATDSSGNTSDYTPPDDKVEHQPPSGSVDLSLAGKAQPSPAAQNGQLTYEFTVTNKGPYEATGILFTDTLPAGVTLVSITPSQGSVTGTSAISWLAGSLIRGQQATIDIVVRTPTLGTLSDTATVTSSETELNPADNQATVNTTVGAAADVAVVFEQLPSVSSTGRSLTQGSLPATGRRRRRVSCSRKALSRARFSRRLRPARAAR